MNHRIAEENTAAESLLPPAQPDKSGVGVNYVDAWIKGLNVALPDGRKVVCKRKGLKITLALGPATGEALLRKREHGPDPRRILRCALDEAAGKIGAAFEVAGGVVYLKTSEN
jgi:hypothetical protein